uniref:Uncharacterized protein n=1 Tax=Cafeteria roenbergensis TaxID=33653 RepID=A0A7S0JQR7_CAFRO
MLSVSGVGMDRRGAKSACGRACRPLGHAGVSALSPMPPAVPTRHRDSVGVARRGNHTALGTQRSDAMRRASSEAAARQAVGGQRAHRISTAPRARRVRAPGSRPASTDVMGAAAAVAAAVRLPGQGSTFSGRTGARAGPAPPRATAGAAFAAAATGQSGPSTSAKRAKTWSAEVEDGWRLRAAGWNGCAEYRREHGAPERWGAGFLSCLRLRDGSGWMYFGKKRECPDSEVSSVCLGGASGAGW